MTHDSLELGVVQGTPGGGVSGGWGGGAAAGVSNVRLRRCDIGRHKLLVSAPVDGVVASATAVSGCCAARPHARLAQIALTLAHVPRCGGVSGGQA